MSHADPRPSEALFVHLAELDAGLTRWTQLWETHGGREDAEHPVLALALKLHRKNFHQWHLEDRMRRTDIPDRELVAIKRHIDADNARRHEYIAAIDEAAAAWLVVYGAPAAPDAAEHTDSPGQAVDRLSVLALRCHHLTEEVQRPDADPAHRDVCAARLAEVAAQRAWLARALAHLLDELAAGRRRFFIAHPHKLYNDPATNPELRGR